MAADPAANFSKGVFKHSLPSPTVRNKNYNLYLVFGRLPAELGPELVGTSPGLRAGLAGRSPKHIELGPAGANFCVEAFCL
jgi:hypothetical protein